MDPPRGGSLNRDRVIGAAGGLLIVAAPLAATVAVLAYVAYGYGEATFDNAVAQGLVPNDTAFAAVGIVLQVGVLAVNLVAAGALLVSAVQVLADRFAGRVGAWVLSGYLVMCFGWANVANSPDDGIAGAVSAFPGWFEAVFTGTSVLLAAVLATALTLLTLRPARREE